MLIQGRKGLTKRGVSQLDESAETSGVENYSRKFEIKLSIADIESIEEFEVEKVGDKSCIPGKIRGNYRVAGVTGQALFGIRVDNFQGFSLMGKTFAQAQR